MKQRLRQSILMYNCIHTFTHTHTHTQTQTYTYMETPLYTNTRAHTNIHTHKHKEAAYIQREKLRERRTAKQPGRQTDKEINRQTNRLRCTLLIKREAPGSDFVKSSLHHNLLFMFYWLLTQKMEMINFLRTSSYNN